MAVDIDTSSSHGLYTFVESTIAQRPIVIFSKTTCPFCTGTKKRLDELNVKKSALLVMELDKLGDEQRMQDIEAYLHEYTGASDFPYVFVNKFHIGGHEDVTELDDSGALKPMLKRAGAI